MSDLDPKRMPLHGSFNRFGLFSVRQYTAQFLVHDSRRERLCDEDGFGWHVAIYRFHVAARNYDLDVGPMLGHVSRQGKTVGLTWHFDVRKEQNYRSEVLLQQVDCSIARRRFHTAKPSLFEDLTGVDPNNRFVING